MISNPNSENWQRFPKVTDVCSPRQKHLAGTFSSWCRHLAAREQKLGRSGYKIIRYKKIYFRKLSTIKKISGILKKIRKNPKNQKKKECKKNPEIKNKKPKIKKFKKIGIFLEKNPIPDI